MGKLVLIDGNAVMHRAYHAMPPLTSKDGKPINAVYGLVSMLIRLVTDLKPTYLAVCFDRPEPTFRKIEFPNYQSHRPETEENLSGQFEKAKEVLESMKISIFEKAGFEADDLIGSIATEATSTLKNSQKIDEVIIVTGDRDILQLVDDKKKIEVFMPVKGLREGRLYKEKDVIDRMGVMPSQIVDYKGLVGDPSDNYPGVTGIGPKTAEKLISQFGSYPEIYKNLDVVEGKTRVKLEAGKEYGDISYKLAKIITDMKINFKINDLGDWDLANREVINIFNKIGFKTLLARTVNSFGKKEVNHTNNKRLTKPDIEKISVEIARKLKGRQYAIRGTAGLVLQGYDMGVNDIDVICDEQTAKYCGKVFADKLVEKVIYSESDQFRSFFGKFNFHGFQVEVMGNLQIKVKNGWSDVYDGNEKQINRITVDSIEIVVTKPELELKKSAEMGRWNEYHKMKKQLDTKSQQSLF